MSLYLFTKTHSDIERPPQTYRQLTADNANELRQAVIELGLSPGTAITAFGGLDSVLLTGAEAIRARKLPGVQVLDHAFNAADFDAVNARLRNAVALEKATPPLFPA